MRTPVALNHAYRLLNHGPATLVTSAALGRRNVMAAAWVVPLDGSVIGAVVGSGSLSRELIEKSGELAINIPPLSLLEATWKCGQSSGRDGDKFEALGLESSPGSLVGAPLVEGCIGWLECRLRDEPAVRERYDLVVADVVAAWADDNLFRDGRWCFEGQSDRRSFHHLAHGHFLESGRAVEASGS